MKKILALILILNSIYSVSQSLNHKLNVKLNPSQHLLDVSDEISIPDNVQSRDSIVIMLNSGMNILKTESNIEFQNIKSDNSYVKKYLVVVKDEGINKINIQYSGKIYDEIKMGALEYARGFSETKGTIFNDGVYLAGSSFWYPVFVGENLSTFTLDVIIDTAWQVVSQGYRTLNESTGNLNHIQYNSSNPVDEIYLIAAKWTEYSISAGDVLVQAFLRTPDADLANRYLGMTSSYLNLYNQLIGPYPYKKFALVENFWETGYGMPSFTLLGEKVIRFPWILYSSYPHELLHNYWGNSVYVDYSLGNWCEGITAYMADHLFKEQKGQGSEYRRNTLQKFTDFVNEENDFPVTKFISRNNAAEEAIGYGKVLMINEMLRTYLGDSIFIASYRYFYNNYKFEKASFNDIKTSFEKVSNQDLSAFFNQWLNRKGAPELALGDVIVKQKKTKYDIQFTILQKQAADVFNIDIPVALYLEDAEQVVWKSINMNKKEQSYSFTLTNKPVKIEIDPEFNVFRKLDVKEVPPSLSQVQGSRNSKIILPKSSPLYMAYSEMAKAWKASQEAQGKTIEIIDDANLNSLPENEVFWVFGSDNKFANSVTIPDVYKNSFLDETLKTMQEDLDSGCVVYALSHPNNEALSIGFVHANSESAIQGLTRKLPHYGKYGFLGFLGDAPDNNLKGTFATVNSPLNAFIVNEEMKPEIKAKIIPRKALAY